MLSTPERTERYAPGTVLAGGYRLEERIGAGGMGVVWRATHEVLGHVVAVKVVQPAWGDDPDLVRRLRHEARIMAQIDHPSVVRVRGFHTDAAGVFLIMEFVDGEALSSTLRREKRLSPLRTMQLVSQAAEALQAAHDRGVVHRDVKPGNLLVRTDGALVLTDFGIARITEGTPLTVPGAAPPGTPWYLAPEQVLGEPATAKSDLYALGVVAYECLTGSRPFDRENLGATLLARVNEAPPTLPATIPPAVCAVLERALARDPAHRWPSAADLAAACQLAAAQIPTTAPPTTAPPTTEPAATEPAAAAHTMDKLPMPRMRWPRPSLAPPRVGPIVAGGLGFVGLLAMCFGIGASSQRPLVIGAAVIVLSFSVWLITRSRRPTRQWIRGTGQVATASDPAPDSRYGRCHLQLVVDAPGLPRYSVLVNDPLVPVARWPYPGLEVPVEVALDDPATVRIQWRQIPAQDQA